MPVITTSSDVLVATVADPAHFLLNALDLASLSRHLGSTYPTLDVDILVREYRRFLVLKWAHRDEHATLLSPSPLLDQVWHDHILDTKSYIPMCLAIGLWIHHDPGGANDHDATNRARRRENTVDLYTARFGPMDLDCWDMDGLKRPFRLPVVNDMRHGPASLKMEAETLPSNAKDQEQSSGHLNIYLRDGCGSEIHLRVRSKSAMFAKVAKMYADKKGLDLGELRFVFDGRRIDPSLGQSMEELDLLDGDIIDVSMNQSGC